MPACRWQWNASALPARCSRRSRRAPGGALPASLLTQTWHRMALWGHVNAWPPCCKTWRRAFERVPVMQHQVTYRAARSRLPILGLGSLAAMLLVVTSAKALEEQKGEEVAIK